MAEAAAKDVVKKMKHKNWHYRRKTSSKRGNKRVFGRRRREGSPQ